MDYCVEKHILPLVLNNLSTAVANANLKHDLQLIRSVQQADFHTNMNIVPEVAAAFLKINEPRSVVCHGQSTALDMVEGVREIWDHTSEHYTQTIFDLLHGQA